MRLVTVDVGEPPRRMIGAEIEAGVVDLAAAHALLLERAGLARRSEIPADMTDFLALEERGMEAARAGLAVALDDPEARVGDRPVVVTDYRLRAPVPRPASLRDFYAFEEHVAAGFAKRGEPVPPEWYEFPAYYKGNHRSIIGPDDDVDWPAYSELLDYELEWACVVGREGRDLAPEEAMSHVAGFTVLDDFSARDVQKREMAVRLGPAKGKDFATAIGPALVTPDEIPDPYALGMRAWINGDLVSDGSTGSAHWTWEQMLAHASMGETVYPGDVLGSGTVGGGCGLEHGRFLQPGDVVVLEVERIGMLRNRIVR